MVWMHAILFYIVLIGVIPSGLTNQCPLNVTVNLTRGQRIGTQIVNDGLIYKKDDYYEQNGTVIGCLCNVKKCIRKCCELGKNVVNMRCAATGDEEFEVYVFKKTQSKGKGNFTYARSLSCEDRHGLYPYRDPNDEFFVQEDGRLYISEEDRFQEKEKFCIDMFYNSTNATGEFGAFVCNDEEPSEELGRVGMIISMPFLLATFLVYALLPDRNLPAKALMCYVLSLLFAYILLVTIQLNAGHKATTCISLAFFCYYFFMASFFWMNSSCLDIFFTFSGIRGLLGDKKKEHKRFAYYSAYAWGVPLLMVGFASIFTFAYTDANNSFYTGLGQGQCWFRNGWATGIYFYFPIAILLIVNMVLFGVTTYKIKRVQKDTKMLKNVDSRKHKYDNNDKQRFNLYVKLLFAMGINWSMEVISWAIMWKWSNVPDYVWVLTDFCNAVYGVFIFFIFVFKRNIWMLLKKRYLQLTGRPQQAHNLTSTHRTTVSQVSSSEA